MLCYYYHLQNTNKNALYILAFTTTFQSFFPFTTTPTSFCLAIISSCQFIANKLFSCSPMNMDAKTVTNKEVYSIHAFGSLYFFYSYKSKFKPSCPIYIISLVCLQINTLIQSLWKMLWESLKANSWWDTFSCASLALTFQLFCFMLLNIYIESCLYTVLM